MHSMSEGIEAAVRRGSTPPAKAVPLARDIMITRLVVFTPEQAITEVVATLLKHKISGAPVVDNQRRLVGIISELDCLRVVAAGAYHREESSGRLVRDLMSRTVTSVRPDLDIYGIAHLLVSKSLRRVPVVDGQELLGQISRRDVLRAVQLA